MTAYALFGAALAMTDLHRVSTTLRLAGLEHKELQYAGYKVIAHIIPAAVVAAGIALLRKRGVKVSQPRPNLLLVAA